MARGKFTKDELREFYLSQKKECEDLVVDIRKTMDACLDAYLCKKDWGDKKKDWQSKRFVPISKPVVKSAVRLIKKAMLDAPDFFDFETPSAAKEKKKLCDISKRVIKAHLASDKFLNKFSETLECGFTLGPMIIKFWVENVTKQILDFENNEQVTTRLPHLRVKVVNPYNFLFTPDRSVHIEHEWIKLPQLKKLSQKNGGPFDDRAVREMVNGDYSQQKIDDGDEQRLKKIGVAEARNPYRKDVLISHYWGPIHDLQGNTKMENAHFIVGNDKYILMNPKENPFYHGEAPYVVGSPIGVLFRFIGKSLIEDVIGLEDAIIEFVNAQNDNLHWIMLGINEVDEMAISEGGRKDLKELHPGKLVRKKMGYEGDAFKHHEMGTQPEKAMPLLQEMRQFYDYDTKVTEYVSSMPATRQETLGEYQGKRQQAVGEFGSIAQDIERGFLVECVDMARDLVIQYLHDFNRYPEIKEIFAEENMVLDQLTVQDRRKMIVNDLDIVGRGISIFFDRMDQLNKLGSYVKMLNALPEDAQFYPRWPEVLKRMNDAFAFDRRDQLVLTDEEVGKKREQMAKTQQQQIQMALQQQQAEFAQDMKLKMLDLKKEMLKIKADAEQKELDRDLDWDIAQLKAKTDAKRQNSAKKAA